MKRKELSITVEKTRLRLVGAQAILSDDASGGFDDYYNHPFIWLKFHPDGVEHEPDGDGYCYRCMVIWIKYQRHMVKVSYRYEESDPNGSRTETPVYGRMDTAKCWGHAYAGTIELSKMDRVNVGQTEVHLGRENKLRLKVSGLIGATISEYNLHAVAQDECEQGVLALEKLGVNVEWMYRAHGGRNGLVDSFDVRDRTHANARKRQEARKQARPEPVVFWTTAPESYDSGTTRTLERDRIQNQKGDNWRQVAIQPDEVEWHRGRYGSGLYECQEERPTADQIKQTPTVETAN